eukprot:4703-Heterococcus_DN1.PRE.2
MYECKAPYGHDSVNVAGAEAVAECLPLAAPPLAARIYSPTIGKGCIGQRTVKSVQHVIAVQRNVLCKN